MKDQIKEGGELISLWARAGNISEEEACIELSDEYGYVWVIALAGLGRGHIEYRSRMVPVYVEGDVEYYPTGSEQVINHTVPVKPDDVLYDDMVVEDEYFVRTLLEAFWKHNNAPGCLDTTTIKRINAFYGEQ